jgi:hypothetical protein
MNNPNERQHTISQVLLERFRVPGKPLQCYQVETGKWVPRSLERACAWPGYNQLLVAGQVDNTLEDSFSKIESDVRKTFKCLEEAAEKPSTQLEAAVYANMCWYCTFLKLIAPVSKPGAVVSFVMQLNMELENGHNSLLRELNVPEATADAWRKEVANGRRVIFEADNALQLLYRFQFQRCYQGDFSLFHSAKWTISKSPIELPISDVGLIPMHLTDLKANHYILPIAPNLVLEGIFYFDLSKNPGQAVVRGMTLTRHEAEYRFDCICASAIKEIVCAQQIAGIAMSRSRARANGMTFHRIVNPDAATSAGLKDASGDFRFRIVSGPDYVEFMHSHIQPRTPPAAGRDCSGL